MAMPKGFGSFTKYSKAELQQQQLEQHEKGLRDKAAKDTLLQEDRSKEEEEEELAAAGAQPSST